MKVTDPVRAKLEAKVTHDMLWAAISEMNRLGRSISRDEMRSVLNAALAAQEGGGGERVTALSQDEFARVVAFCENSPPTNEELKKLYRRYLDWKSAAQEGTGNG